MNDRVLLPPLGKPQWVSTPMPNLQALQQLQAVHTVYERYAGTQHTYPALSPPHGVSDLDRLLLVEDA